MAFSLQSSILPQARFSRAVDVGAIAEHRAPSATPVALGKAGALAHIRAQLAAQRN